jgi:hypothetical protein
VLPSGRMTTVSLLFGVTILLDENIDDVIWLDDIITLLYIGVIISLDDNIFLFLVVIICVDDNIDCTV